MEKDTRTINATASCQFLISRTQAALEEMPFLGQAGISAKDSVFSALCFTCLYNNTSVVNELLSSLNEPAVASRVSRERVFEFYYELSNKFSQSVSSSEPMHARCHRIAQCSLAQMDLDLKFLNAYASFLASSFDLWQQLFSCNQANKRSAIHFSSFHFSPKFFLAISCAILCIAAILLFKTLQTEPAVSANGISFSVSIDSGEDPSTSQTAPSFSQGSYEYYVDYYQKEHQEKSERSNSLIEEKYYERLENADLPVYIQEGDSYYHLSETCPQLQTEHISCTLNEAAKSGHPYPCPECTP